MMSKREKNICEMIKGNKAVIKECLYSESKYVRMDSLLWTAYHKFSDPEIIERIIELKSDDSVLSGYTVGNYAIAALDALNIEKYSGDDDFQQDLIAEFTPTELQAESFLEQCGELNNN